MLLPDPRRRSELEKCVADVAETTIRCNCLQVYEYLVSDASKGKLLVDCQPCLDIEWEFSFGV